MAKKTKQIKVGHTPGPWSSEPGNAITADFGGVGVAILEPIDDFWCGDCSRYPTPEEMAANARLIAAAPELLAALKNLLCEADDDGITREGVDRALAAIDNAERQP